jgi:hypothetical protein
MVYPPLSLDCPVIDDACLIPGCLQTGNLIVGAHPPMPPYKRFPYLHERCRVSGDCGAPDSRDAQLGAAPAWRAPAISDQFDVKH